MVAISAKTQATGGTADFIVSFATQPATGDTVLIGVASRTMGSSGTSATVSGTNSGSVSTDRDPAKRLFSTLGTRCHVFRVPSGTTKDQSYDIALNDESSAEAFGVVLPGDWTYDSAASDDDSGNKDDPSTVGSTTSEDDWFAMVVMSLTADRRGYTPTGDFEASPTDKNSSSTEQPQSIFTWATGTTAEVVSGGITTGGSAAQTAMTQVVYVQAGASAVQRAMSGLYVPAGVGQLAVPF